MRAPAACGAERSVDGDGALHPLKVRDEGNRRCSGVGRRALEHHSGLGVGGKNIAVDASAVVEDVEQPAVDDGVEGLAERVEVEGVEHLEARVDAAQGWSDIDGASSQMTTARGLVNGPDGFVAKDTKTPTACAA